MIHTFEALGCRIALDVASGAVHVLDQMSYDLLNCVDLLVLPSSLEGLPLVVIEALSCGAHVVATNVIGTAEAVGRDNAIDLGDDFVNRFTDRAVQLLHGGIQQVLPTEVSWTATAIKENGIYHRYLDKE